MIGYLEKKKQAVIGALFPYQVGTSHTHIKVEEMGFSQNRNILQWGRESGISRPRRLVFTLHTREMFLCSAGSIFNDLCKCMFSFCLLFFMEVVKLSAADTGLIILIGQIVDALTSVISGYLGDMVKVPVLSQKMGMRKSWHLMATVFMGIVVPLCVNRCILCSGSHQTWLPTVYYGFLFSLYNISFSVMEINHLAFITTSAVSVEELTDLSAIRFAIFKSIILN